MIVPEVSLSDQASCLVMGRGEASQTAPMADVATSIAFRRSLGRWTSAPGSIGVDACRLQVRRLGKGRPVLSGVSAGVGWEEHAIEGAVWTKPRSRRMIFGFCNKSTL